MTNLVQTTDILPNNFQIRILLHGLLLSAFKEKNDAPPSFEVGVLCKLVSGHTLSLIVAEVMPVPCPAKKTLIEINENSHITLEGLSDSLSKYHGSGTDNTEWEDEDFRWALDYEDLYPKKLKKYAAKINPRFTIENGTVSSLLRSSKLETRGYKSDRYPRRIAQVTAIDIQVKANETPVLYVTEQDEKKQVFYFDAAKRYNIAFRYDCSGVCYSENDDLDIPVDLRHLNDSFKSNAPNEEYTVFHNLYCEDTRYLEMRDEIKRAYTKDDYATLGVDDIFPEGEPFTRSNPCGMGYFGKSKGLPD